MAQDKVAREANRMMQPREYAESEKRSRRRKKTMRGVMQALATQLKKDGVVMPYNEDPVAGAIAYSLIRTATQDVFEMPSYYCPVCRRTHKWLGKATCDKHPEAGDLDIVVPEAKLQSNSVQAAGKLMDKLYPNLSAVSATVNIEGKLELMVDKFVQVIIKYVPGDQRQECMSALNQIVYAIRDADEA
jgi:hypothetical protein